MLPGLVVEGGGAKIEAVIIKRVNLWRAWTPDRLYMSCTFTLLSSKLLCFMSDFLASQSM